MISTNLVHQRIIFAPGKVSSRSLSLKSGAPIHLASSSPFSCSIIILQFTLLLVRTRVVDKEEIDVSQSKLL